MPQRVVHLLLGVLGLVLVAALFFGGASVRTHRFTGARWKRRLISAGLALWGLLGLGGPAALPGTETVAEAAPPDPAPSSRATEAERRITAVTEEAQQVASGKRGQYPFDGAGRQRLLDGLTAAERDVVELQQLGWISEGAAGLLKQDLKELAARVAAFRPTEMRHATCYEPMPLPLEARKSLHRLKQRLPFLEKLAAQRLNAKVVRLVLQQVESDLQVLRSPGELAKLAGKERQEASQMADRIKKELDRVKARLGEPPSGSSELRDAPEWREVADYFATVEPLAARSSETTSSQRQAADGKKAKVEEALAQLVRTGRLSRAESDLLRQQVDVLRAALYRDPPKDSRVTCYRRAFLPPARQSLTQLEKRLPLLGKLAAAGKLKQPVMDRLLPALERELRVLSDPQELGRLPAGEREKAEAAAKEARRMLKSLEKLSAR